jgi:hypothetical protein
VPAARAAPRAALGARDRDHRDGDDAPARRSEAAAIDALRARGLKLLLDDFGTGYSSLSYLQRFPLDGPEDRRGFVAQLPEGRNARAVVEAIVGLARALSLVGIAEGVETEAQARWLREAGCDELQASCTRGRCPPRSWRRCCCGPGARPESGRPPPRGPPARHGPASAQPPWHCLNFLPDPQGHGSLRPTFVPKRRNGWSCRRRRRRGFLHRERDRLGVGVGRRREVGVHVRGPRERGLRLLLEPALGRLDLLGRLDAHVHQDRTTSLRIDCSIVSNSSNDSRLYSCFGFFCA